MNSMIYLVEVNNKLLKKYIKRIATRKVKQKNII